MKKQPSIIQEVKDKGVLFRQENGCAMYLIIGRWNLGFKKPDHHWYMYSEKTGLHCVTTQSNRPDEKVNNHWDGFLLNQNRVSAPKLY